MTARGELDETPSHLIHLGLFITVTFMRTGIQAAAVSTMATTSKLSDLVGEIARPGAHIR